MRHINAPNRTLTEQSAITTSCCLRTSTTMKTDKPHICTNQLRLIPINCLFTVNLLLYNYHTLGKRSIHSCYPYDEILE